MNTYRVKSITDQIEVIEVKAKTAEEAFIWEQLEDLIYKNCNKTSLNFDEYETKYGVDLLRENLNIKGILKCINLLNKENDEKLD